MNYSRISIYSLMKNSTVIFTVKLLCKISLRDIGRLSHCFDIAGEVNLAGTYGCEVSSEAPNFLTAYDEANMSVAVPPKTAPALEGVRPSYEVGEILEAECTSGLSYPPAVLTFILNGKEVSR